MYPQPQLAHLASRKHALLAEVHQRRARCAEAAAVVTRPLHWIDQLIALWRDFAPFALATAIPLGLLARQRSAPPQNTLRTVGLTLLRTILGQR